MDRLITPGFVISAVPFGVAAAGAWLAGGVEVQVAPPPDLAAGSSGWFFRIATWVGYALGTLLGGFLLVGAGMTLFAKAREQPRLVAARRLAEEGKLEKALAVCERAVGKGPVDLYFTRSDASREMAWLAVSLVHRLGRPEDARRRYSAIESSSRDREVALLAEDIGQPDRALSIWEDRVRLDETRAEALLSIERLRSGPQGGAHPGSPGSGCRKNLSIAFNAASRAHVSSWSREERTPPPMAPRWCATRIRAS